MSAYKVTLGVQSFYNSNTVNTTNSSFTSVLKSLASGLLGTPTGAAEGGLSGYTSSTGPVYGAITSFLSTNDPAPPSGYPKAYLNWILLDDQFNYVSSSSGSVQAASSTYPAGQLNSVAPGGPVVMPRNGYLYIWVSNETQGWDVFFDNLSVQYKQGPILEENHYYPYGLTMAGISDKALKTNYAENKYRFNSGNELQNKEFSDGSGLELYDAHARSFDPQLGRFWQIDSMADRNNQESLTPYQFGTDDPSRYNDPSGKCPNCIIGAIIGAAVDATAQVLVNKLNGQSWSEAVSNIDYKEVGVAATAGFVTSGISAIYGGAAAAGTDLALSKGAAGVLAGAATSVLNQANDAANKGEPLDISPVKIVTDIATDKFSDHLSEKLPEIKINGGDAPKLNEATKTAAGDVASKTIDVGAGLANPGAPAKFTPVQLGTPTVTNAADATAHKMYIPKINGQ
jgi:RHS repeat-associated protein